jgi:hypothetical protein
MRKKFIILLTLFLLFRETEGQVFNIVSLTTAEKQDKSLMYHYSAKFDNFSGADIYLYSNGRFIYHDYTDLAKGISTGLWTNNGNLLSLRSELRQNTLPVKVNYLMKAPSDIKSKKFAIIKDLSGREYTHAAIHINDDSVSCFWGDMQCFGTYSAIDSVKVEINSDITSDWIKVDSTKEFIELILQTDIDFDRYFPIDFKLKKDKGKLTLLKN